MRPLIHCSSLSFFVALASSAVGQAPLDTERFGSYGVVSFSTAVEPSRLGRFAVGDVNGDGIADLVAASGAHSNAVRTLGIALGRGGTSYAPPQRLQLPENVGDIEIGDIDGDGDNDIVLSGLGVFGNGSSLMIIRSAAGALAPPVTLPAANAPEGLELADMDGDGDLDIVVGYSHYTSPPTEVFWNNGSGVFPTRTTIPFAFAQTDVLVADLDSDGLPDVVCAGTNRIAYAFGIGNQAYSAPTVVTTTALPLSFFRGPLLAAGDFDGDGDTDVVAAGLAVFFNDGTGALTQQVFQYGGRAVAARDLDRDGRDEIVTASPLSVWEIQGGSLVETARYNGGLLSSQMSVWVGDIDGDHRSDVVLANFLALEVRPVADDGRLRSPRTVPVFGPSSGPGFAVADLDLDGRLDIAAGNPIKIQRNLGGQAFAQVASVGSNVGPVRIADMNGDGLPDLVWSNSFTQTVTVSLNQGVMVFAAPIVTTIPSSFSCGLGVPSLGDIDGDSIVDCVIGNSGGGPNCQPQDQAVVLLRGVGNGTFAAPTLLILPNFLPRYPILADFDGDSDLDLAVIYSHTDRVAVLRNSGTGTFTLVAEYPVGSGPVEVLAADLDLDGVLDLVTLNEGDNVATESISVFHGDGTGGFTAAASHVFRDDPGVSGVAQGTVFGLQVADLDGDLLPEILCVGFQSKSVGVWRNSGTGFLPFQEIGLGPRKWNYATFNEGEPGGLAAADFDGDGSIDLIAPVFAAGGPTASGGLVALWNDWITSTMPALVAIPATVSAAVGGSVQLPVDFSPDIAGSFCIGAINFGDPAPGFVFDRARVFIGLAPAPAVIATGILDSAGDLTGSFSVPAQPALAGIELTTVFAAAVSPLVVTNPARIRIGS